MNPIFRKFLIGAGGIYSKIEELNIHEKLITIPHIGEKRYTISEFKYNGKQLVFWETAASGFLAYSPDGFSAKLLPLHRDILQAIGVVKEVYSLEKHRQFFENFEYIFNGSDDEAVVANICRDYQAKCMAHNLNAKVDCRSLFPLAYEANGNVVLYDNAGKLYFYAYDLARDDVAILDGCPELTFYTFESVLTFDEYVERFFSNY